MNANQFLYMLRRIIKTDKFDAEFKLTMIDNEILRQLAATCNDDVTKDEQQQGA